MPMPLRAAFHDPPRVSGPWSPPGFRCRTIVSRPGNQCLTDPLLSVFPMPLGRKPGFVLIIVDGADFEALLKEVHAT